jgi:NADPH-dependent 2,4-dienoyl-CoA reductase/sulfur reductase-like enzyme
MKRRQFIQAIGAGATLAASVGCAGTAAPAKAKVVVIGGGYGGATAAKYLRMWSEGGIDVTLVEPNPVFISCPISNLVLGGSKQLADITLDYDSLARRHGVTIVRDLARSIDPDKRTVKLAGGRTLSYDRLILSPGIDFIWDQLPGMKQPGAQDKALHAWKAGAQTVALRRQLEAMPDGGVFVMSIPQAPYRCPPGPYERACQVAHYFSRAKPKSKVLVLDGNDDVTSKGPLFKKAWAERYKDILEYRPKFVTVDVDTTSNTVISELGDKVQGAVLNVIPPQRAGAIAAQTGLANVNKRWCEVDFLTFESTQAKNVHLLGDAIQTAPLMPKSAHMANQHAKVCAAAVIDLLNGKTPQQKPMLTNTCYSFVSDKEVIHVASVHAYDAGRKTMLSVPGAGGLSRAASELEGLYAMDWARNIWADSLL